MSNKRLILFVCVFLIFSLLLSGCAMPFRRPEPQRTPEETPQPTQPAPNQPARDDMNMADRIADLATDVEGVDSAVVVVVSNLALVGITLQRDAVEERDQSEIKQEVATCIEDEEPGIVNAYVSANPDIVKQLREISQGIQRGEPISAFFNQIADVLERMRAETGNETIEEQ